ncbi:acyclic terpene utilization AtuA family protein [Alkalihalobacillus pseudalcaliphilus]|uniref:acyclic terpene utilization AtuA family protein n=1 Tax=Alkalihalobacillus pseudalcaliphilus TaxID=79884 RepID=UPI00064D8D9F|nr:acyclic terpene utilization AtuA family protein [Alkalihalobacillus pseudalcaliphilus]KMK75165.1 ABC transporter substrate-binding protein [Alkalihalobacillus pseudalcaliphilus]
MKSIRIGTGAGYAGDRIDAAIHLIKKGELDYLVLECLAERTTALANLKRKADSSKGYGPFLHERMVQLLPLCQQYGVTLITNIGAANPEAAVHETNKIASDLSLSGLKIVGVSGSNVLEQIIKENVDIWETGSKVSEVEAEIVSADAYLGVEAIIPALEQLANVIITGRVADPSLFLAPMIHELKWAHDDWHLLGQGTICAHLLECGAQVTGGYYADGYKKQIQNLSKVGMPIVEMFEDGTGIISKTPDSGGEVSVSTCKEQLLYEVMNPAEYITPDVIADFSEVEFLELAKDQIQVLGGTGKPKTDTLKVTIGVDKGFIGESFIAYGGHHALERAEIAKQIIEERLHAHPDDYLELKFDFIGCNSLYHQGTYNIPYELLLRVSGRTKTIKAASKIGEEVEALWLNGPGGPGGVRSFTRPIISAYSALLHRSFIQSKTFILEVK